MSGSSGGTGKLCGIKLRHASVDATDMVDQTRWMGLILFAVVGTTAAVATSEKTLANWMTPSRLRPKTSYAFEASRDGRWVRTATFRPGEPGEERVLEIATGRDVDATAEELAARFAGLARPWYHRTHTRSADGRVAVTIAWPARGLERTFVCDSLCRVQAAGAEGVVFEELLAERAYELLRHDLSSGETRRIVRSHEHAQALVSRDGESVILNEFAGFSQKQLPEHRGVRILDARDGAELSWIAAPWAVVWVGDGHRHVQTELDGRLTVQDLERGTRVALETHFSTLEPVEVLPDGNLLQQDGPDLLLCDGRSGAVLRRF